MSFRVPSLVLAAALLAPAVTAQGAGFTPGDVWESNDALHLPPLGGASLRRINPWTGQVTPMVGAFNSSGFGSLAYDTYRQRLVWRSQLASTPPNNSGVFLVDGFGQTEKLPNITASDGWYAPTGDGRIFCTYTNPTTVIHWLDAANRLHTVMDASGTAPFNAGSSTFSSIRGIQYDPATNAIFVAGTTNCSGAATQQVAIEKVPLSADGTRVAGPPVCATYDVTSSIVEFPTALTRLPDGRLLVVVIAPDSVPITPLPRLLAVDPATMIITPFAEVGHVNTALGYRMDDGVWSSALGKALVLDTFQANLRAWSEGETGDGVVITPVGGPIAIPSAESEQIAEIPDTACDGAWIAHGTGLAGKGGVIPGLFGETCPQPGALVTLHLDGIVGGATGTLFAGLSSASVPFKGGVFRVGSVFLAVPIAVGGAAGVAGAGSLDLPALLPNDPMLSGLDLWLQAAFADGATVKGASLTQGLQMTIG